MCSYCLRERENPRRPQQAFSKLYQHFRVRGHPYGLQDTLSTLRPSCSSCVRPRLRHGRKTRYGWVARPYPTRTFTLQETPSLSWRDNAAPQPLPEAGARHERTLEAVGCRRWFGGVADGTGGGSAHHTLLEDKVLTRGHRLQQLRQFVQRWHGGPPLVPGIGIAGLGAQPRSSFG